MGRYRYKRLVFGISCAPEMFQNIMDAMFSPCKNVVCYLDDILIYGENEEEHDHWFGEVMKILRPWEVLRNVR